MNEKSFTDDLMSVIVLYLDKKTIWRGPVPQLQLYDVVARACQDPAVPVGHLLLCRQFLPKLHFGRS